MTDSDVSLRFAAVGIRTERIALMDDIKRAATQLERLIDQIRPDVSPNASADCARMKAMAMTQLEISVMCAVKALSRENI